MAPFVVQYEVRREGEVLICGTLGRGEPLTVGPRCARIPCPELARTYTLLTEHSEGLGIRLRPPLRGTLFVGGHQLTVGDGLLRDPRPEPLLFRDGDRGQLHVGEGLLLRFIVVARSRTFRRFGQIDWSLASTLLAAATAILAVVAVATSSPRHSQGRRLIRLTVAPRALLPAPPPARRKTKASEKKAKGAGKAKMRKAVAKRGRRQRLRRIRHWPARTPGTGARRASRRRFHRLLAALDASVPPSNSDARQAPLVDPLLLVASSAPMASLDRDFLPPSAVHRLRLRPHPAADRLKAPTPEAAPSREAIANVVKRGSSTIRRCFERELLLGGDAIHGRILVRWRIDRRGAPVSVKIMRDGVRNASIRRCILAALRSWHFPACAASACEVVYPFEFYLRP